MSRHRAIQQLQREIEQIRHERDHDGVCPSIEPGLGECVTDDHRYFDEFLTLKLDRLNVLERTSRGGDAVLRVN